MGKVYLLLVCIISFACYASAQEAFFDAFPLVDKEEFSQIPPHELVSNEVPVEPAQYNFDCPSLPIPVDVDDVNKLQPGHIKVITSLGDSITCGYSAKDTSVISLKQYRGLSFPIGADPGVITLPNLIKQYSPPGFPIGGSIGTGLRDAPGNGLNGAVSGAINSDLLGQAQWLVEQLKANKQINMAKDWKMLSVWIGSNNLCQICNNYTQNNGDNYEKHMLATLDYLYANVPRLFVNLLPNLDITQMYQYKAGVCSLLHGYECPCATSTNAGNRQAVSSGAKEYLSRAIRIAANFRSRNNKEFAVVVQPFLTESLIFNRSYLSAADCFHPSAISHVAISTALWNSLLTPSAQKKFSWNPDEVPVCATANSLFHTD